MNGREEKTCFSDSTPFNDTKEFVDITGFVRLWPMHRAFEFKEGNYL